MISIERKLGVILGVPSLGTWEEGFGTSLVSLLGHFMNNPVKGYRKDQWMRLHSVVGSILPRQRKMCIDQMFAQSGSHVCFVDSDQTFPRDTVHRLLAWDKDIVGCNIPVKKIPSMPTARGFDKQTIYTEEGQEGLEKVWSVGCGLILIKRKVFEAIGVKHFEMRWIEEIQDYGGEDWSMLAAARGAGFEVWIDHGLSNEVGHLGTYKFTHDVVGEVVMQEEAAKLVLANG